MKTKLEMATLAFEYLDLISYGYENGDFSSLFPCLAEDCVLESQWVMTPNVGYDAVTDYLSGKGETLKRNGTFPTCSIQELVGNINVIDNVDIHINGEKTNGSVGLHYSSGELCLLMEQTIDDKTNSVILRIKINNEEKISRIDLCMPELFQYRDFYTFISLYPCDEEETVLKSAKIHVSEPYYSEFYLFLGLIGEEFDEDDNLYIPMEKWLAFLERWKCFYSFETFDEAFEDACGIDYTNFTVKDDDARRRLGYNGDRIWDNRNNNAYMLKNLIEWTEKYKDSWSYVHIYGF